jgi:hypothetical protein
MVKVKAPQLPMVATLPVLLFSRDRGGEKTFEKGQILPIYV